MKRNNPVILGSDREMCGIGKVDFFVPYPLYILLQFVHSMKLSSILSTTDISDILDPA